MCAVSRPRATPFANQVFDLGAVEDYHFGTGQARVRFWRYRRDTDHSPWSTTT